MEEPRLHAAKQWGKSFFTSRQVWKLKFRWRNLQCFGIVKFLLVALNIMRAMISATFGKAESEEFLGLANSKIQLPGHNLTTFF